MGYDLCIKSIPFDVTGKTTASILMKQLIKVLSNGVSCEERGYDNNFDWYATALEYMYFEDLDCRGCYQNYVITAFILSYIFVWKVIGIGRGSSMVLDGDDGATMVSIRVHKKYLSITILADEYDECIQFKILRKMYSEIIDDIRQEEVVEDDKTYDCEAKVKVDKHKITLDNVTKIAQFIENNMP